MGQNWGTMEGQVLIQNDLVCNKFIKINNISTVCW